MTAELADWFDSTYTQDEILYLIRFREPAVDFRSAFSYCNVGYLIAGKIIEKVSGMTWEDFITQRILKPLGMNYTSPNVAVFADSPR